MAGRGVPPKDPTQRARRNKDVVQLRTVEVQPAQKPELPTFSVPTDVDGKIVYRDFVWPETTKQWWADLDNHPLKGEFIETDWSYLLDTARLHAEFWAGKLSLAAELRLREAKYGFTPEDRARLRIQFAEATGAEVDTAQKVSSARQRMQGIKKAEIA